MINAKLFSLDEFRKEKHNYFSLMKSQKNIFNSVGYMSLYENERDKAFYYISNLNDHLFVYSFLLCEIPGENIYKDIKSPYSFGGPVSNTSNITFIKNSFKKLREVLRKLNVICEVIKFNPYIPFSKEILESYDGEIIKERELVIIDFNYVNFSNLMNTYKKECKKKIKSALIKNKNHEIKIGNKSTDLKKFKKIYEKNLDLINASKHYYYNDTFYDSLIKNLSDNFLIFSIYIDGKIFTSQLLIHDDENVYCHMYGAINEARKKNIIVYSYHALISWAADNGFKKINLGGGNTSDPNDSLFTFKKNFSNNTIPFYIGEKIFDDKIYNQICEKYSTKESNYLQKYRL